MTSLEKYTSSFFVKKRVEMPFSEKSDPPFKLLGTRLGKTVAGFGPGYTTHPPNSPVTLASGYNNDLKIIK